MAHVHQLRDTDTHYSIDPLSRSISRGTNTKSTLIQYDHNSEILTFEMPRYVEGHDMLYCNQVEVHYINSGSGGPPTRGVYEVSDFEKSEDDDNTVVWSWMVSANATQNVGPLVFAFRFACLTGDEVDYSWSTAPFSGMTISEGIYNGEAVVEQYIDILEQWEHKIGVSVDDIKQATSSDQPNGANVITMVLSDGKKKSFVIRNGITPIRGIDYWTEEDKQEIINSILDVIPRAEEASF